MPHHPHTKLNEVFVGNTTEARFCENPLKTKRKDTPFDIYGNEIFDHNIVALIIDRSEQEEYDKIMMRAFSATR